MPLLKPSGDEAPALHHAEERDWWALRMAGKDSAGKKQLVEVIVVGKAAE